MKTKFLATMAMAGFLVTSLSTGSWAAPPKLKMTTDIPASITAAGQNGHVNRYAQLL